MGRVGHREAIVIKIQRASGRAAVQRTLMVLLKRVSRRPCVPVIRGSTRGSRYYYNTIHRFRRQRPSFSRRNRPATTAGPPNVSRSARRLPLSFSHWLRDLTPFFDSRQPSRVLYFTVPRPAFVAYHLSGLSDHLFCHGLDVDSSWRPRPRCNHAAPPQADSVF